MYDYELQGEIGSKYMTIRQACELRGVHRTTIISWFEKGLKYCIIGSTTLIRRRDVLLFRTRADDLRCAPDVV